VRTVGIEEELLLVDAEGQPAARAEQVLRLDDESRRDDGASTDDDAGGTLEGELQQEQVEIGTPPRTRLTDLDADVRAWRDRAEAAAEADGLRVVATATSPLPAHPTMATDPRYQRIAEKFGRTAAEVLACGCHVHVATTSREEAVGVLDRIRVWLPTLLAVSANSPFWQGADSSYESYRSQVWSRWPSSGPMDVFGSPAGYDRTVEAMLATGVMLDRKMVYFDARLSASYPTVEIRVADVCLRAEDAVLLAGLCRALVETAAGEWAAAEAAPAIPTAMLRLAMWQAGREGLTGDLLDPRTMRPRPAADVLADLLEHVRPALADSGDEALVEHRLEQVLSRGTGARRQRATYERTGDLADVVADATRVTAGRDS
jgi:carboxylate-amine ligase